ncbi:MAG: hypothetical protein ABFS12_11625 [Bacteroidota bacterium]
MSFNYKNNTLFWDQANLFELADKFKTPFFILNEQSLINSGKEFLQYFNDQSLPVSCYYSLKTNPVPYMLKLLKNQGVGIEIISEYEMWLAKKLNFNGDEIIVNGPAKSDKLIADSISYNVKMLSIESISELDRVIKISKKSDGQLNCGIRISPQLRTNPFNLTLGSSKSGSPYGLICDSDEIKFALEKISSCESLNFMGFNFHLGSGIKSSRPYKKSYSVLERAVLLAKNYGLESRILNIGGGFGSSSAPILSFYQLAKSFASHPKLKSIDTNENNTLREVSKGAVRLLKKLKSCGIQIEEVITEPGRKISGNSQILILKVLDIIKRKNNKYNVICDGGAMSISPMLLTEHHKIFPLLMRDNKRNSYSIYGNLPSTMDKVTSSIYLPKLEIGDYLGVLDAGAYFIPFNNNFNGPRPSIISINKNKYEIIRKEETLEDIVRNDLF